MRRSTVVTLTLLAGAGLGLAYCHQEPDSDGVLETEAACVNRLGADAASECSTVFEAARQTHLATAPHFDSPEACRAATGGDCTTLPADPGSAAVTAASVFVPVMAGVMIGRALSDGTRGAVPVYAGAPPPACPPGTSGCPASSSGSGGSGSRRYWYSGGSYAGSSDSDARGGFRRASTSVQGDGMLSRGARGVSAGSRSGLGASRSGGFGFSAAAHSGGGS